MFERNLWTREAVQRHSVDLRQFIDFRQATLASGQRVVEVYNSSGLHFTILPDRGLDIWTASYKGLPLTWISLGSPQAPDYGEPWLRQFPGGLLATCGLTHFGPPETDPQTGETRDLHGRYNRLRAESMGVEWLGWGDDGKFRLRLSAMISEAMLFSEQLRLIRSYTITLGEPVIEIRDVVSNVGDQTTPLMILYHFNVGYPLVSAGARLYTAHEHVYARDEEARQGIDRWSDYDAPTPRYPEQVFFHHVRTDATHWSEAALLHEDFGLSVQWDTTNLPYLTQWKNTRESLYVCGIEPGNNTPGGRNAARETGTLRMIEPGETVTFQTALKVIDGAAEVATAKERIAELQQTGTPAANVNLSRFA